MTSIRIGLPHLLPGSHLAPLRYASTAATHPGCVRKLNEDACLDLPDAGLWAVADGMGGHDAGDVASTAVIEALRQVRSFESAYAMRKAVRAALVGANTELQAKAADMLVDTIGSTVVTLLAYGDHYACLWAGDSRAYLWRARHLLPMTRDHRTSATTNTITRAVGARPELELDCTYGRILPGDRFLLCSDGLGILSEAEIARAMSSASVSAAAQTLLRQTIAAGAPDNVTVVVVEVSAGTGCTIEPDGEGKS